MNNRNTVLITLVLAGLAFMAAAILFPQMTEPMAVHWGADGTANGYGTRFEGLFLLPIIALAVTLLMLGLPYIDPLKKNIENFRTDYNLFVVFMSGFFYYIFALTIMYNFDLRFSMTTFLQPAYAILMIFAGRLLKRTKRNYFIGIRTPWTLANDVVWEKTHRFGGSAFQAAGLICLVGMFFPAVGFFFLIVPILGAALLSVVYSYFAFRSEEKKLNLKNVE